MKFYSDIKGNQSVIIDGEKFKFIDGELETKDKKVIGALSKYYRSDDDGREAVERDEGRQEVEEEQAPEAAAEEIMLDEGIDYDDMNVIELRELAKAEGITGRYGKRRSELIEALKEGE